MLDRDLENVLLGSQVGAQAVTIDVVIVDAEGVDKVVERALDLGVGGTRNEGRAILATLAGKNSGRELPAEIKA